MLFRSTFISVWVMAFCLLSKPAHAESIFSGEYELRWAVFNSTFLQPNVAKTQGLVRDASTGYLNVVVLKGHQPIDVELSGVRRDLTHTYDLSFKKIEEGSAVYYLAPFPFYHRELQRFTLNYTPEGGKRTQVEFQATLWDDNK